MTPLLGYDLLDFSHQDDQPGSTRPWRRVSALPD